MSGLVTLAGLLALLPPPADAPAKPLTLPADFEPRAAEYMNARLRATRFSGAVLVAVDGRSVFRHGYGTADLDHDVPNTPATKFRIGSLTKQFTAAAVLLLEQQGKLSLSDPVGKHVADCPKAWADVTIHQLLSHTAGVPEHTTAVFLKPGGPAVAYTPKAIIDLVKDKPLDFTPGEKWDYTNTGYILLGMVIEAVSGKGYEAFMREAVFDPLGLADTGVERNGMVLRGRATGYARGGGDVAQYVHMSLPHAAGAMYSTVDDLLAWDRALASNKLLGPEATKTMFTPVKDDYACGIAVRKRFGRTAHEHGGGIPGFVSALSRYPDVGLFVVVLSNNGDTSARQTANDLAAIALGEKYELPQPPGAKPKEKDAKP